MISFAFTDRDKEILEEARRRPARDAICARLRARRGRTAAACLSRSRRASRPARVLSEHEDETSGAKILNALLYLEDWRGGVPLREHRYSLGNTVLKIAGTTEQYARWSDKTIAIGLTEAGGGSDPASTRTTATWDAATREWVIDGEKLFITYAESCDAVLVLARVVHPERARGYRPSWWRRARPASPSGASSARWASGSRTPRRSPSPAAASRLQPYRRRSESDAAVFSESRPVVAAYALGVSRAALDFTWARLAEIGIRPDYDKGSRR